MVTNWQPSNNWIRQHREKFRSLVVLMRYDRLTRGRAIDTYTRLAVREAWEVNGDR